jgi:hypothetical protein
VNVRTFALPLIGLAILLSGCSSDTPERSAPSAPVSAPSTTTATPAAPKPAPPSPVEAAFAAAKSKTREEQKDVIANLVMDGVFSQIELQDGVPRVSLRPAFKLLSDREKHLYLATVYTFAFPDGPGPGLANKVVLIDSVSGQETGSFTDAGFQMK